MVLITVFFLPSILGKGQATKYPISYWSSYYGQDEYVLGLHRLLHFYISNYVIHAGIVDMYSIVCQKPMRKP